jgi:hypothetical protein
MNSTARGLNRLLMQETQKSDKSSQVLHHIIPIQQKQLLTKQRNTKSQTPFKNSILL